MNRIIHALFLLVLTFGQISFSPLMAQGKEDDSSLDRLKSQKVAFLTERIGLSEKDAQLFWPLYNEMSEKMDKLWDEKKKNINKLYHSKEPLSEAEKEVVLDEYVDYNLKKAKLEKEYHEKFKKILTIDQIIKYYGAEHEFKKKMLHQLRGDKPTSCSDCQKNKKSKDAA